MHRKWLYFCGAYGRSSFDPSQADVNAYVAWLQTCAKYASPGKEGEPMAYDSIVDYVGHVGRLLKSARPTGVPVVTESMQTHLALQSTKRVLGQTRQRARPISLKEVRTAVTIVTAEQGFVLAFQVVALTAWYAALRLGQLLPHGKNRNSGTLRLSDLVVSKTLGGGQVVLVTTGRSKTNVFKAKLRTVAICAAKDPAISLDCAVLRLQEYCRARGLPDNVMLADIHPRLSTFEAFVGVLHALIPASPATPFQKGHITGHSFRRGFTKAALERGFSIEQIMLHGDWSRESSVLNSYAAGAVLPSIPLAQFSWDEEEAASSFVSPIARAAAPVRAPEVATASAVPMLGPAASVRPQVWTEENPFASSREYSAWPARAALWELDQGHLSAENPFTWSSDWSRKRAREWELENNPALKSLRTGQ